MHSQGDWDMTLEVFWFSGSAQSWRVLLTLELKGVAYESRLLQASQGEHKAPDYLALNPRGKVPSLRDGDFVMSESLGIMRYIEARHPEPPLFGTTPEEKARIAEAISEGECYFMPAFLALVVPIVTGGLPERGAEVTAAVEAMLPELDRMERRVACDGWLATDALTAADVATYPVMRALLRLARSDDAKALTDGLEPFEQARPALADWIERIAALPGHDRTYPPHWREAA